MQRRTNTTLLILLLLAGAGNAYVCHDTDINYDTQVVMEIADVIVDRPPNGSVLSGNPEFSLTTTVCHVDETYYNTLGLRLTAETADETTYTNSSLWSPTPDNVNATVLLTLPLTDNNYNYTVDMKYIPYNHPTETKSYSSDRYLLTITSTANVGEDTGGACLTPFGYKYSDEATTEEHIRVRLPEQYCVNVKCENAHVLGGDYYVYDDYEFVINTTLQKPYTVYVGGWNYNYSVGSRTPSIDATVDLRDVNSFTQQNNVYWIDVVKEEDGDEFDYDKVDEALLKNYCQQYSPDTQDVKDLDWKQLFMSLKEQPIFELKTVNNSITQIRKQTMVDSESNITLVQAEYHETPKLINYYFILEDFTGEIRKDGLLYVKTNVNGSIETVHSERWYYNEIHEISLINGSDYQVELIIPNVKTVNYGWITPEADGYKTLVVSAPVTDTQVDHYEGLYYKFISIADSNVVGYNYNFTTDSTINWVNFTVINSTGGIEHQSVSYTPHGQLLHTLNDPSQNYQLLFEYDVDDHSYDYILNIYKGALNTTAVLRHNLDLSGDYNANMADFNLLGVEGAKIETFTSWFLIGFVALIASAGNYGLIMIAVMVTSGVLSWVGYIPDQYFYILVGVTAVIAVLAKLGEDKSKK
jgi:hypothetical protein